MKRKTKHLSGVLAMLAMGLFADEVPSDYEMNCRQGPYAPGSGLKVQAVGDRIEFHSSRWNQLILYENLLDLSDIPNTLMGSMEDASFSFPAKDCSVSSEDPKIITCFARSLVVEAKGSYFTINDLGNGERHSFSLSSRELTDVTARVRRVHEVVWGSDTWGYELTIGEGVRGWPLSPLFVQRYFTVGGDEQPGGCIVE